ncbi:lipoprotein [Streptomyces pseudogriseolus]|nr:lipoprotein [Streptomyces gancidicus]
MKRRTLPIAVAFAAASALFLAACGGDDGASGGGDEIAGVDTGKSTASPTPSRPDVTAERPDMTLPQDVEERFEGWKTGDATKDAVLADAGSAQTAVTYAVTKGDPESPALRFYQSGSALAGSQDWVKGIVDAGLTYSGSVRYFAPEIRVFDKQSAGVSYCADESKAYNKNRKTNKVDKTPATDDSYVLYSTRLEKNDQGVWQTTKLESERGNKKCVQ